MELGPTRTAVVVVGMQNGLCHPDGSLFTPGSESAIEPVTGLAAAACDTGMRVVYTRDMHPPEQFEDNHYYDKFERWGEHVVGGTWNAALHGGLDVRDEDLVVEKHTYDAFYRTQLMGWFDSHSVDDLLICGTLANVCVLHTAGGAGFRGYRPILATDALGYIEEEHKAYAVDHTDWLFSKTTTLADVTSEQTDDPVERGRNPDSNPDPDADRDSGRVSLPKEPICALSGGGGVVPVARR